MNTWVLDLFEDNIEMDVLLIQPSSLFQTLVVDPEVCGYFEAMSKVGKLTGDSPMEANYGLLKLATNLNNRAINTKILDFNAIDIRLREQGQVLTIDLVDQILNKFTPRIYGISYMASTYGMWEEVIYRSIRNCKIGSVIPIIYGGIHPSVCWQDILQKRDDKNLYIMVGEGDKEFPEFCNKLLGRSSECSNFRGIANYSVQPEKQIITSQDFTQGALPDYDLLPEYAKHNARRFYLTRGCTGGCAFCSVSSFHARGGGRYYRQLVGDRCSLFRSQISRIMTDYQDGMNIIMGDLTFFETDWYFKEFCVELSAEIQRTGIRPEWWCQTRADCITPEMATIIKETGCTQVAIGCESASNEVLRNIRKNITVDEWKRSLDLVKRNDMLSQAYIIIGSGFEDRKSVEKTIETILTLIDGDLIDLVHLSVLVPYPGTILYDTPERCGIEILDRDFRNYWMNCDLYGYGMPVYRTISKSGKILLENHEIYSYWKLALNEVSKAYQRKYQRSLIATKENVNDIHALG